MSELEKLAQLLKARNAIDDLIASAIKRPAMVGHIGEYIAATIFAIELAKSATNAGSDGRFTQGHLKDRSVNIKWYWKNHKILDIIPEKLPDYYLVLTGPLADASTSRGTTRPALIKLAYLFHAKTLVEKLRSRPTRDGQPFRIGVSTSVAKSLWNEAEIYPRPQNATLRLTAEQRTLTELFG